MNRLQFPSRFAKAQIRYRVNTGDRIYLYDLTTQFIYKVGFNVGEIEQYGLPRILMHYYPNLPYQPYEESVKYPVSKLYSLNDYIRKLYSVEETILKPSALVENTIFSLRTLDPPSAGQEDEFGNPYYADGDKQLNDNYYEFYADQLIYDAQLKETVFMKENKFVLNIKNDAVSNAAGSHLVYDPVGVTILRNTFVPYAQQKTIANDIMVKNKWAKNHADKHYLCLFKPNNVALSPRILIGLTIESLRQVKKDDTRY